MRKKYSKALKFKVAMEASIGNKTITDISSKFEVTPSLVHKWKKQLKERGASIFGAENRSKSKSLFKIYCFAAKATKSVKINQNIR